MLLEHQRADVDHPRVLAVAAACCRMYRGSVGDPRAGWELVQRDWDLRQHEPANARRILARIVAPLLTVVHALVRGLGLSDRGVA